MKKLKFAVFGCGSWSNYQIPGWLELNGVELTAIYNRTRSKAETLAAKFGIPKVYDNPEKLFESEDLDFVDIITDIDTHYLFTELAAKKGVDVVCQNPMAPNLDTARKMVNVCHYNHVKLFINENFRWQAPIRKVKQAMDSGVVGEIFKSRVSFCSALPSFENKLCLARPERDILTNIGFHILDICRYLLGEVKSLYCKIQKVNPESKREDVANVFMEMKNGTHCFVEMSYASLLEKEVFPQPLILLEGTRGSIKLDADYELKITTKDGTTAEIVKPVLYSWIDPEYAMIHSGLVEAQRDIINGLNGGSAETTGADQLKTNELVFLGYESAAKDKIIHFID